jgi:hypothetical protein
MERRIPASVPLRAIVVVTALGLGATPAWAQTPLVVAGDLVIDGGGTNVTTLKFTSASVSAGTGTDKVTVTLNLSPAHPTVVIRGSTLFGGACSKGSDCWNSDTCADNVCGWSGIELSSTTCGVQAQLTAIDQTLDDCVRLWAVDNPVNLTARADKCMQVGSKLYGPGAVVTATCPELNQYRDAYDLLFTDPAAQRNVLTKAIRGGVPTSIVASVADPAQDAARVGQIKSVLRVIDSWFRAQVARLGTANDSALFAKVSDVEGMFWKTAFVNELIAGQVPPVSAADASNIADKIQKNGFVADKQVLRAAFDTNPPLQTAPLLLVAGDAISGLAERTQDFASLQDVVCRVRPCFPGRTSIGNYMKVLGSLAKDPVTLGAAVALADTQPNPGEPDTRASEWNPVFTLMKDQHVALENAVLSATDQTTGYTSAMLETDDLATLSKYAVPLASIVRSSLSMSLAFENTGTFRPRPRKVQFGLDATRNDLIRAEVDGLCKDPTGVIPQAIATYQANQKDYVTSALNVAQAQFTAQKAAVQLNALEERYRNFAGDMNGLRATKQADEMKFGDFMASFQGLAPAIAASQQAVTVSAGAKDIDVAASNARYNPAGGPPTSILDIAVLKPDGTPWIATRNKGDMVNFAFTGKWAPTCALRDIQDPNGKKVVIKDASGADVATGPEGYGITNSGVNTTATSESWAGGAEAYVDVHTVTKGCGGLLAFGLGANTCLVVDAGVKAFEKREYSSSSGGSTMNSFSWGTGIRSDETPFPSEPVGSLLLVELPTTSTAISDVRSVQILTYPQASTLVGDTSNFYLVVNDKTSCTPLSAAKLGVRVAELIPGGTASQGLAQAMSDSLASMRTKAQSFIDQGQMLPGQRDELRTDALNDVFNNVLVKQNQITSLSDFTESLRNLFETFVNKQITDIDREIALINIERQIKALVAEEGSIRLDMAASETAGRVASLLGGLAVRNLDLTQLESKTAEMSDLVRDWMDPVFNLRLTGGLTFGATDKQLLDAVINLSPGAKYVDNIDAACKAVDLLTSKITLDKATNPDVVVRSVVLSIPEPNSLVTERPLYREIDAATATRLWDNLRQGGDLDLSVTPAMFYENKEPFSLTCSLSAPVVRSMAYMLVTPGKTYGTFNSEATTVFPDMRFPRSDDLFTYSFANGLYLTPQLEILNTDQTTRSQIDPIIGDDTPSSYWSSPAALSVTNKGTSPFTTYHLDLSRLRNTFTLPDGTLSDEYPFKNGSTVLVAFQVEAVPQLGTRLPGVPPCDP